MGLTIHELCSIYSFIQPADLRAHGGRVGCEDLLLKINELSDLKVHAFGHIHEGYGVNVVNDICFVNACSLDEKYQYSNEPISVEL